MSHSIESMEVSETAVVPEIWLVNFEYCRWPQTKVLKEIEKLARGLKNLIMIGDCGGAEYFTRLVQVTVFH